MSAQSLQVVTLVFPDPDWSSLNQNALSHAFHEVNSSISYSFQTSSSLDIRTLSTDDVSGGDKVPGLLYVPSLAPDDPCVNASEPYVPNNVTRQADLPDADYNLIAIAPWISASCTQSYLASARQAPVRGFLFFLAGDNGTETPPEPVSPVWSLNDGGSWKRQNHWPVYALPGLYGQQLMQASALYSGDMTQSPYAQNLTDRYDPRDYVRLYVNIDTAGGARNLPSLWVFLLVVLGILLLVIGLTSLATHWIQRRRRQALRVRVANGEVDLEALGIKRLTVPQEILHEMPLYIYGTTARDSKGTFEEGAGPDRPSSADSRRPHSPLPTTRPSPALIRSTSYHPSPLQQPTCAICLDDFVPASPPHQDGTTVRELPCHHIFHPECVDTFLRDNSSLCPMCKKTALPKGYCPQVVTNAMVRRERMVRRTPERATADPSSVTNHRDRDESADNIPPLHSPARNRTFSGLSQLRLGRRISSAPTPRSQQMAEIGPSSVPPIALTRSNTATPMTTQQRPIQPPLTPGRREWARQRAVAMLGRTAPVHDPDEEEARRTPRWRKALRGVFPSVGR